MKKNRSVPFRNFGAAVFLGLVGWAHAQGPELQAGNVLRNIEQGLPRPPALTTPNPSPAPISSAEISMGKLVEVQVDSDFMPQEIKAYWLPSLNRGVQGQEIASFKAWLWDQLQTQGILAYVTTTEEVTSKGSILKIKVVAPTLGRVSVVALDQTATHTGSHAFANEVARRFSTSFGVGSSVDVQAMSARLNAIAYDLPLTLEAVLRQPDASQIDVVINMRLMPQTPGRLAGGVVQLNNHGLKAYGRGQVLTQIRVQGQSPLTEYGVVAQVSKGVKYLSANRIAAIAGWQSRGDVSASATRTDTQIDGISTDSDTFMLAGGLTTLLASDRDSNALSKLKLSHRTTTSKVASLVDTQRSDLQLQAKISLSGAPAWITAYDADVLARTGRIDTKSKFDQNLRGVAGHYQVLETAGYLRQNVSKDRRTVSTVRWRAQKAFQNLDSYNQFSLGGVNGIRAYTSSDGVGDEGAQLSFEITHTIRPSLFVGLLYDVGWVTQNIKAVGGVQPDTYQLSGAGFQLGGNHGDWGWNAVVSRGLDKTKPFETAATESLQTWRGLFALNYRF